MVLDLVSFLKMSSFLPNLQFLISFLLNSKLLLFAEGFATRGIVLQIFLRSQCSGLPVCRNSQRLQTLLRQAPFTGSLPQGYQSRVCPGPCVCTQAIEGSRKPGTNSAILYILTQDCWSMRQVCFLYSGVFILSRFQKVSEI